MVTLNSAEKIASSVGKTNLTGELSDRKHHGDVRDMDCISVPSV